MIQINKGSEPKELTLYRTTTPNPTYKGFQNKEILLAYLLKEQGFLCAYCMGRMSEERASIEHFEAQNPLSETENQVKTNNSDFEYYNLLAVCREEGLPKKLQHCDVFRGNKKLYFNPSNQLISVESLVTYSNDGTIKHNGDLSMDKQLVNLNLNVPILKNNRAKAKTEFFNMLKPTDYKKSVLNKILKKYIEKSEGKLSPYVGIILYFLKRKIASLPN